MMGLRARAVACVAAALLLFGVPHTVWSSSADLVIVVDDRSPIRSIPIADVRRRYLGIPLVIDGVEVIPVRNLSNADFYEMFLQRVLFMSAEGYERRMLNKIFREGGDTIASVSSREELERLLHGDTRRITFLPRSAVGRSLRIIAEP